VLRERERGGREGKKGREGERGRERVREKGKKKGRKERKKTYQCIFGFSQFYLGFLSFAVKWALTLLLRQEFLFTLCTFKILYLS
jgi:hypothetical protein